MRRNHSRISTFFSLASLLSTGLLLTACGGGGGNRVDDITNRPPSGQPPVVQQSWYIGNGSGSSFQPGVIGVGIGEDTLSAGGSTSLTINLVNSDYSLSTGTATLSLTSRCIAANEAILSENPITTLNGQATVTYTANGCVGEDHITATTTVNERILSASAYINVEADSVSSIQFLDAEPNQISLKGTGGTETSVVRFLVRGSTGAPIKDTCVEFQLASQGGGLSLANSKCDSNDPADAKRSRTNAEGIASIVVQAGTVAMPVTLTAKHLATGLTTQSRSLYVSTGVPDQKSMSLSASVFNPHAWEIDGAEVLFTVRLADAFNNPPADGTPVSFTTSGGSIDDACTTENGVCSVVWRSQNPRPQNSQYPGLVRVLAHAQGNESFVDVDGDGWHTPLVDTFAFDTPECAKNVPRSSAERGAAACDDLGEAFLDHNHTTVYEPGKVFIDANGNLVRDGGNGVYNGVLCLEQDAISGLCSREPITIRRDFVIVMSSNHPMLENTGRLVGQPAQVSGKGGSFNALLADQNGNPLPAGTKVELDATNAKNVNVSPKEITIPSTHLPQPYPAIISPSGNEAASGYLLFHITAPDGTTVTSAPTQITP